MPPTFPSDPARSPVPAAVRALGFLGLLLAALIGQEALPAPAPVREPTWLSDEDRVSFEPGACVDAQGRTWVAWVSWRAGERLGASNIEVVRLDGGKVVARAILGSELEGHARPRLAPFGDAVYCVFEARAGGDQALWGRRIQAGDAGIAIGPAERITPPGARPIQPALCATSAERLELYWQQPAGPSYDLQRATRGPDGWTAPVALWATPQDEWDPRCAVAPDGSVRLAFDRWDGASSDVFLAEIGAAGAGAPRAIAAGPAWQAYPDLAVAADGSTWIAWEECDDFGRDGPLRDERRIRLARVRGQELELCDPKALDAALPRGDLPRVLAHGEGVVVTARRLLPEKRRTDGPAAIYSGWTTAALVFGAGPRDFAVDLPLDGDNEATEVLFRDAQGRAWCAFASDQRTRHLSQTIEWFKPIEGGWRVGLIELPAPLGAPPLAKAPFPAPATAPPAGAAAPPANAAAKEQRLLTLEGRPMIFGDLHRHTHLSRCAGAQDGLPEDAYRYARGPGKLDFLAITDHFQHLRPWSWWRTQRDAERYLDPGRLVTFGAIERMRSPGGHFNEIYADAREAPYNPARWNQSPEQSGPTPPERAVLIPHMLYDGPNSIRWAGVDSDRVRLVEVFQGSRGSYEGDGLPYQYGHVQRPELEMNWGLANGHDFGLIAASDHNSTGNGLCALFAPALTRESVFAALRSRESLACITPVAVDARLGPLRMGQSGPVALSEPFRVTARGPSPVATIEVVKNGKLLARAEGSGPREILVFSVRVTHVYGLAIGLRGGQILGAEPRQTLRNATLTWQGEGAARRLVVQKESWQSLDLVLEVEWEGDPAQRALLLDYRKTSEATSLAEVAPGGSLEVKLNHPADDQKLRYPFALWRVGAPLGEAEVERAFEDPGRVAGDYYYARVAFLDGNLAWTSPIRIEDAGPDR